MAEDPYFQVLKRNAGWAETFGGRRPTNLAERVRESKYEMDKEEYAAAIVEQEERAIRDRIATDKTAQDLYFRSEELKARQAQASQKMRQEEELHPLRLQAQQSLINQRTAAERKTLKEEELKNRIQSDALQLQAEESDFILKNPNASDEQLDEHRLQLSKRFPFSIRDEGTKELIAKARTALDKRALERRNAELAQQSGLEVTRVGPSGPTYGKPADKMLSTLTRLYDSTLKMRDEADDEDVKKLLDSQRIEYGKKLRDLGVPVILEGEQPQAVAKSAPSQEIPNTLDAIAGRVTAAVTNPSSQSSAPNFEEEYAKLPSGSEYIDPSGVRRRKK